MVKRMRELKTHLGTHAVEILQEDAWSLGYGEKDGEADKEEPEIPGMKESDAE